MQKNHSMDAMNFYWNTCHIYKMNTIVVEPTVTVYYL